MLLSLCLISPGIHAETPIRPLLHRGVNIASWLGNAPRHKFYPRDFQHIKESGFDFVRLPINPEFFGFSLNQGYSNIHLEKLDQAMEMIINSGLDVVLDMHPRADFMKRLENDRDAQDRFIDIWLVLAKRYKCYSPHRLVYNLLNEPHYYRTSGLYNQFMARLVAGLRQEDRRRLLIIEVPAVSSHKPLDALNKLGIIPDKNLAYAFHYYQPYLFTHQGVTRGFEKKQTRFIRDLPYPSDQVDKEKVTLTAGADRDRALSEIEAYKKENWNHDRIMADLAPAAEWAQARKVPLMVLEFGVMRATVDAESRYRWIRDVRSVMDSLGIGWALWDYTDLMGIVRMIGETRTNPRDGAVTFIHPEQGQRQVDDAAKDALGLHP